jgi:hypothetical protein
MDSEPSCAGSAIRDLASHLDQRDLDDCDKGQFARRWPYPLVCNDAYANGAYSCETGRNGGLQ